jgi:hypothetical protein
MRALPLALAALVLGAAPAPALAAPADVSATHAYILASHRLAQASVSRINAAQAKIEGLNSRLARECPHAAAGSPQNDASQPMAGLVVVAEWSIAFGTNAGPINTFLGTVRRLHWSSHAITRIAQRYATSLHEMATLPMPNLCQAAGAWKANGFQTPPAGVVSLVQHAEAIELNRVPGRMLAPYERGGDASILKQTDRLQWRIAEAEFVDGEHDLFQLLETLSINE